MFILLTGSLESDKIYEEGDRALVLVSFSDDTVVSVSMIDHYRLDLEAGLLGAFFLFLVFGRKNRSAGNPFFYPFCFIHLEGTGSTVSEGGRIGFARGNYHRIPDLHDYRLGLWI